MKPFAFTYVSAMPEHVDLNFVTNGHGGGDSSHGGYAELTVSMKSRGHGLLVTTDAPRDPFESQTDDVSEVKIAVKGDWELDGLAVAFLELGRALMARDDALACRQYWHDSENDYSPYR
jgi:hypothetical protein